LAVYEGGAAPKTRPVPADEVAQLFARTEVLLAKLDEDRKREADQDEANRWTKAAGVSLVLIAVLAGTAVEKTGSFSGRAADHINQSIFLQVKASDAWAFYQSKTTKAQMYLLGAELVEHLGPNGEEEARMIASVMDKQRKYDGEKDAVRLQAEALEKARDEERALAAANSHAHASLGKSVLGYQLTIAVASVGLVVKRRALWLLSLAIGATASAWFVWSWLHAPPL
jgi:hypothetical protein